MNSKPKIGCRLAIACLAALFSAGALAANNLPRLQFGIGDVKAVSPVGKIRKLIKGDVLLPGEKMVTGHGAMAQLRIFEQGVVVLKDRGQLELNPAVDGKFSVSLDQGLLRTVTKLGHRRGKIDVATSAAEIVVQSGDVLTGVGVEKSARATTHNHVLDGKVTVKTSAGERDVGIGKTVKINPLGGEVNAVDRAPDVMQLSGPAPSNRIGTELNGTTPGNIPTAPKSGLPKIAGLEPKTTPKNLVPRPGRLIGLGDKKPIKRTDIPRNRGPEVIFDGVRPIGMRPPASAPIIDKEAISNIPFIVIPGSLGGGTTDFVPITPTNPVFSKLKPEKFIDLSPGSSVMGESTYTSPELPNFRLLTLDSGKVDPTNSKYDQALADTIKKTRVNPGKTKVKPVRCKTCVKGLTLIKP